MRHSNVCIRLLVAILGFSVWTAPGVAIGQSCVVANTLDVASGSPPAPDSLRDCLTRARSGDTIIFDANVFDLTNSDAATVINVLSELPPLDDGDVTIDASNRRVTINGSAAGSARGLVISSGDNRIRGLAIEDFSGAGIQVTGAANVVGGDRRGGTGPNGQGLRISGNGTYGVEILGAGAAGNVVKGCWIGLDKDGGAAQPNLRGLAVLGGGTGNTIGGAGGGVANVISGNSFEGVTVSGTGTDDNVVIGNVIGETGSVGATGERAELGNGSSGVFLSQGTKGTRLGGTDPGEANVVANNGGNGVEVRSIESRKNSARQNRISKNKKGGIALFDGSNDGILPPHIASIQDLGPNALGTGSTFRVSGSTPQAGSIEVFNDSGSQGGTFLRAVVGNGTWTADVDLADLLNITATVTDAVGNTSEFGTFGPTDEDTDGDGFPDEIEHLAGTDPADPLDTPELADATPPLDIKKVQIGLNFAQSNKDALALTASLALPPGVTPGGAGVGVYFAGHSERLVLDEKGKAVSANGKVALKTSKQGSTSVQYGFKKATLGATVAPFGLTNTTTAKLGERWVLPVVITVGKTVYSTTVTVTYKAKTGKTGKAK